jgi:MoxR-like ATPase
LSGREYALPDDVQALAVPVLSHRLLPTAQAQLNRRTAEQIVLEIVQRVPVPTADGGHTTARQAHASPLYGARPGLRHL